MRAGKITSDMSDPRRVPPGMKPPSPKSRQLFSVVASLVALAAAAAGIVFVALPATVAYSGTDSRQLATMFIGAAVVIMAMGALVSGRAGRASSDPMPARGTGIASNDPMPLRPIGVQNVGEGLRAK